MARPQTVDDLTNMIKGVNDKNFKGDKAFGSNPNAMVHGGKTLGQSPAQQPKPIQPQQKPQPKPINKNPQSSNFGSLQQLNNEQLKDREALDIINQFTPQNVIKNATAINTQPINTQPKNNALNYWGEAFVNNIKGGMTGLGHRVLTDVNDLAKALFQRPDRTPSTDFSASENPNYKMKYVQGKGFTKEEVKKNQSQNPMAILKGDGDSRLQYDGSPFIVDKNKTIRYIKDLNDGGLYKKNYSEGIQNFLDSVNDKYTYKGGFNKKDLSEGFKQGAFGNSVGDAIGFMIEGLAPGGVAGKVTESVAQLPKVTKAIQWLNELGNTNKVTRGIYNAAKAITPYVNKDARTTGMGIGQAMWESIVEAKDAHEQAYNEARKKGLSHAGASRQADEVSLKVFGHNMGILGLSNKLEAGYQTALLTGGNKVSVGKKIGDTALEILLNAGEEIGQTRSPEVAKGNKGWVAPLNEEEKVSGFLGGVTGGILGVGGSLGGTVRDKYVDARDKKKAVERAVYGLQDAPAYDHILDNWNEISPTYFKGQVVAPTNENVEKVAKGEAKGIIRTHGVDNLLSLWNGNALQTEANDESNIKKATEKNTRNYFKGMLGIPYVYGGTSKKGYDCSGFTQAIFKGLGISLPRTSEAQRQFVTKNNGTTGKDFNNIPTGALLFRHGNGRGGHVAIYLGNGMVAEAGSKGTNIHKETSANLKKRFNSWGYIQGSEQLASGVKGADQNGVDPNLYVQSNAEIEENAALKELKRLQNEILNNNDVKNPVPQEGNNTIDDVLNGEGQQEKQVNGSLTLEEINEILMGYEENKNKQLQENPNGEIETVPALDKDGRPIVDSNGRYYMVKQVKGANAKTGTPSTIGNIQEATVGNDIKQSGNREQPIISQEGEKSVIDKINSQFNQAEQELGLDDKTLNEPLTSEEQQALYNYVNSGKELEDHRQGLEDTSTIDSAMRKVARTNNDEELANISSPEFVEILNNARTSEQAEPINRNIGEVPTDIAPTIHSTNQQALDKLNPRWTKQESVPYIMPNRKKANVYGLNDRGNLISKTGNGKEFNLKVPKDMLEQINRLLSDPKFVAMVKIALGKPSPNKARAVEYLQSRGPVVRDFILNGKPLKCGEETLSIITNNSKEVFVVDDINGQTSVIPIDEWSNVIKERKAKEEANKQEIQQTAQEGKTTQHEEQTVQQEEQQTSEQPQEENKPLIARNENIAEAMKQRNIEMQINNAIKKLKAATSPAFVKELEKQGLLEDFLKDEGYLDESISLNDIGRTYKTPDLKWTSNTPSKRTVTPTETKEENQEEQPNTKIDIDGWFNKVMEDVPRTPQEVDKSQNKEIKSEEGTNTKEEPATPLKSENNGPKSQSEVKEGESKVKDSKSNKERKTKGKLNKDKTPDEKSKQRQAFISTLPKEEQGKAKKLLQSKKQGKTIWQRIEEQTDKGVNEIDSLFNNPTERMYIKYLLGEETGEKQEVETASKGAEVEIATDNGTELKAHYVVVEADNIISSTTADFGKNEDYPKELQPRDREDRVALKQQVQAMASGLKPKDLGESRNLNQGAPVIRLDNVVLNGNGRTLAIQLAMMKDGEKKAEYIQYLKDNAEKFGLNQDDISGMKKPVLVRMLDEIPSKEVTEEIINSTTGGARMGASEQAKADAKKLKEPSIMEKYEDNEAGSLTTEGNRDFVNAILNAIASKDEINAYLTEDGRYNSDGIARVIRALYSKAYDNARLINNFTENVVDEIRNINNGLLKAASEFAKYNILKEKGQVHDIDVVKPIVEAVNKLSQLRKEGKKVEDELAQVEMFDELKLSDEAKEVLKFINKNKRSANKLGMFFRSIAKQVINEGNPEQPNLFEIELKSPMEIIEQAERVALGEADGSQLELTEANKEQASEKPIEPKKENEAKEQQTKQPKADPTKKKKDKKGNSTKKTKEEEAYEYRLNKANEELVPLEERLKEIKEKEGELSALEEIEAVILEEQIESLKDNIDYYEGMLGYSRGFTESGNQVQTSNKSTTEENLTDEQIADIQAKINADEDIGVKKENEVEEELIEENEPSLEDTIAKLKEELNRPINKKSKVLRSERAEKYASNEKVSILEKNGKYHYVIEGSLSTKITKEEAEYFNILKEQIKKEAETELNKTGEEEKSANKEKANNKKETANKEETLEERIARAKEAVGDYTTGTGKTTRRERAEKNAANENITGVVPIEKDQKGNTFRYMKGEKTWSACTEAEAEYFKALREKYEQEQTEKQERYKAPSYEDILKEREWLEDEFEDIFQEFSDLEDILEKERTEKEQERFEQLKDEIPRMASKLRILEFLDTLSENERQEAYELMIAPANEKTINPNQKGSIGNYLSNFDVVDIDITTGGKHKFSGKTKLAHYQGIYKKIFNKRIDSLYETTGHLDGVYLNSYRLVVESKYFNSDTENLTLTPKGKIVGDKKIFEKMLKDNNATYKEDKISFGTYEDMVSFVEDFKAGAENKTGKIVNIEGMRASRKGENFDIEGDSEEDINVEEDVDIERDTDNKTDILNETLTPDEAEEEYDVDDIVKKLKKEYEDSPEQKRQNNMLAKLKKILERVPHPLKGKKVLATSRKQALASLRRIRHIYYKGVPLNHQQAGVGGYYNSVSGEVRLTKYGDIRTACHEIGHVIDHKLGIIDSIIDENDKVRSNIDQEIIQELLDVSYLKNVNIHPVLGHQVTLRDKLKEGIACFLPYYFINKNAAKFKGDEKLPRLAPKFYEYFENALENDQELKEQVITAQNTIHAYYGQELVQRQKADVVTGTIGEEVKFFRDLWNIAFDPYMTKGMKKHEAKKYLGNRWLGFYANWVDKKAPLLKEIKKLQEVVAIQRIPPDELDGYRRLLNDIAEEEFYNLDETDQIIKLEEIVDRKLRDNFEYFNYLIPETELAIYYAMNTNDRYQTIKKAVEKAMKKRNTDGSLDVKDFMKLIKSDYIERFNKQSDTKQREELEKIARKEMSNNVYKLMQEASLLDNKSKGRAYRVVNDVLDSLKGVENRVDVDAYCIAKRLKRVAELKKMAEEKRDKLIEEKATLIDTYGKPYEIEANIGILYQKINVLDKDLEDLEKELNLKEKKVQSLKRSIAQLEQSPDSPTKKTALANAKKILKQNQQKLENEKQEIKNKKAEIKGKEKDLNDFREIRNKMKKLDGKINEAHQEFKSYYLEKSEEDIDKLITDLETKVSNIQDMHTAIVKANAQALDWAEESGMVSHATAKALRERWGDCYVPFERDFSDDQAFITSIYSGASKKTINTKNLLHSFKGADEDIISPLENTIRNVALTSTLASNNSAGKMFAMISSSMQQSAEISVKSRSDDKKNAKRSEYSVWVNGKQVRYQTTKEIYAALSLLEEQTLQGFWKRLEKFTNRFTSALRTGATLSPSFTASNLFRDTLTAFCYSRCGFTPVLDNIKGFKLLFDKDFMNDFIESGGNFGTFVSMDRDELHRSLMQLERTSGVIKYDTLGRVDLLPTLLSFKDLITNNDVFSFLGTFSEMVENSTRLATYHNTLEGYTSMWERITKNGTGEKIRDVDKKSKRGRQKITRLKNKAAMNALDGTLNFGRSGSEGGQVNKVVPFFNAWAQGLDKLIREMKGSNKKAVAFKIMLSGIALPLALWLINKDNDDYKALPDFVKDNCYCIPCGSFHITIPIAQEVGIFAGLTRCAMEYLINKDPRAGKKAIDCLAGFFLPNMTPVTLNLLSIWQANKDTFFRKKIDTDYEIENLNPEDRYNQNTSFLAKKVGKGISYLPFDIDISPKKIDAGIYASTGSLGKMVSHLPDVFDKETSLSENLNRTAREGFYGRFVKFPNMGVPQAERDFMEDYDHIKRDYKGALKRANREGENVDSKLENTFLRYTDAVNEIKKQKKEFFKHVADNPRLTTKEKEEAQKKLNEGLLKQILGTEEAIRNIANKSKKKG